VWTNGGDPLLHIVAVLCNDRGFRFGERLSGKPAVTPRPLPAPIPEVREVLEQIELGHDARRPLAADGDEGWGAAGEQAKRIIE
jgi:hypothetical protein